LLQKPIAEGTKEFLCLFVLHR